MHGVILFRLPPAASVAICVLAASYFADAPLVGLLEQQWWAVCRWSKASAPFAKARHESSASKDVDIARADADASAVCSRTSSDRAQVVMILVAAMMLPVH
jgi:hypothetical protein